MDWKEYSKKIKRGWNWIWNSDSIFSWIIALLIIFVLIKFIFFPFLSLVTGSSLPLAGVESSSMDHQIVKDDSGRLNLCGKVYTKEQKEYLNFHEYWNTCGPWYEKRKIIKSQFADFSLRNGFKKGDIIIVWGRFTPKIGDVIIFQTNPESSSPHPISRTVKITYPTISCIITNIIVKY